MNQNKDHWNSYIFYNYHQYQRSKHIYQYITNILINKVQPKILLKKKNYTMEG